jgi:signal transduction histidine kinase
MRPRRYFWQVFVVNALFLIVASFGIFQSVQPQNGADGGFPFLRMILSAAASMAVSAAMAGWLARRWRKSFRHITQAARSLSRGELSTSIPVAGADETEWLARSLERLRGRFVAQLDTIERQRSSMVSLIDHLHEGVIVVDPHGRIFIINRAASRLVDLPSNSDRAAPVGMALEECVLDHDLQQLLWPSSLLQERNEPIGEKGDDPRPAMTEANVIIDAPDGRRTLLARASDIALPGFVEERQGDDNPGSGRLLVVTDVTEMSRMLQMKTDFVANASHELRTPVAAIRLAVETLRSLDPTRDAQAAANFVEVIARHGERLEHLVRDLLDLARVESSNARFELNTVNLPSMIEELRAAYELLLIGRKLSWEAVIEPECRMIGVNAYLLRMTLSNLIDNAVKFTSSGGYVRVRAGLSKQGVIVQVSDNGCGISAEDQTRVFERFYQVERARTGTTRGTGLGLSIVRHAAAAMAGEVQLESRLGEGTSVTLNIPHRQVPADTGSVVQNLHA